jgi:ethanolamine utilization protein EutN
VKLARVVGTVVSTIKSPIFEGRALLLVDLLEPDGREAGGYLIALDTVGAGAGETVLVLDEGTSARQIIGAASGPLRTVIVGIVDAVEGPASVAPGTAPGKAPGATRDDEEPGPSGGRRTDRALRTGGSAPSSTRRRSRQVTGDAGGQ